MEKFVWAEIAAYESAYAESFVLSSRHFQLELDELLNSLAKERKTVVGVAVQHTTHYSEEGQKYFFVGTVTFCDA